MAVLGARRLANSGKATRLFGGRAVSTVSSAHPQLLARSSLARVLRSQARCGRRRAGLPPTPFGLPAFAVAGFLLAHGFGEAKPKPCEGWRRGPDDALAKSDAPLAEY